MSDKDWRVRVDDIREALARAIDYVDAMDEATFIANDLAIDAVVRNLEIIGEAAARMPHPVQLQYPLIPWEKLAEMRNLLIHEYHSVSPEVIYRTVVNDLPPLLVMVEAVDLDSPTPIADDSNDKAR